MTNLRKLTNNHRTSLDSLCWFSQRCSSTPHFWGWPHIRTRPRFLYNVPTPKFHHPMFTRSEVIVLTNKHTPLKTFNALRYATLGKMFLQIFRFFGLRDSELTLDQFRRSLKTHLFKHIFGHWQLQRRVTVFFVRCAQIDLLTYLLTYLNQSVHEYGNNWHTSVHFCTHFSLPILHAISVSVSTSRFVYPVAPNPGDDAAELDRPAPMYTDDRGCWRLCWLQLVASEESGHHSSLQRVESSTASAEFSECGLSVGLARRTAPSTQNWVLGHHTKIICALILAMRVNVVMGGQLDEHLLSGSPPSL